MKLAGELRALAARLRALEDPEAAAVADELDALAAAANPGVQTIVVPMGQILEVMRSGRAYPRDDGVVVESSKRRPRRSLFTDAAGEPLRRAERVIGILSPERVAEAYANQRPGRVKGGEQCLPEQVHEILRQLREQSQGATPRAVWRELEPAPRGELEEEHAGRVYREGPADESGEENLHVLVCWWDDEIGKARERRWSFRTFRRRLANS